MSEFIDSIRQAAIDQVRLLVSPFRGAIDAIKAEVHRPMLKPRMDVGLIEQIRELVKEDVRLFFMPFTGAIDGVKAELRRQRHPETHVSANQEKGSCT